MCNMQKLVVLVLVLFSSGWTGFAHGNFILHCKDMMEVFGFEYNTKLFNRSKDTKSNQSWTKFISSDMIDNTKSDFHKRLDQDYPGLNISHPRDHRLLFHWAYEAKPWSEELEKFVLRYCEDNGRDIESTKRDFMAKMRQEQSRRNKQIIKKTEQVFGLAHGGTDRVYSHFLASMAYNVHILGDYTSDNTVLSGLYAFEKLVGQFVVELRKLDYARSGEIVKGITKINNKDIDVQKKADELMSFLKLHVPSFIKEARNGGFKNSIERRGFSFK